MRRRSIAPLASLALLGAGLTACGGSPPPDLAALQSALVSGHFAAVALAGAQPSAVDAAYRTITQGLGGLTPIVTTGSPQVQGSSATAAIHWSWPIGTATWAYDTTATLTKSGNGWLVSWSPSLIEPELKAGSVLRASSVPATRGDIVGAGGTALMTNRAVTTYGIDKSKVSAAVALSSARALARLLGLQVAPYVAQVKAAGPRQWVPAITYRRDQAPAKAAGLTAIPGAAALSGQEPLAPYKGFASALLGEVGPVTAELMKKNPALHAGDTVGLTGLEARYDAQLRGTPGTTISLVTASGQVTPLYSVSPVAGKPLTLTLDEHLQAVAEKLLAGIGPASAVVALRPSTGAILVAANGPGTGVHDLATYGQEPPGSTFKMFDSLALIRKGYTANSTVTCSPKVVVDGKAFKNDSWYPASALGKVPLKTAVAQSCNTAMINARGDLGDVASAAATLGFGIDHDAGFPAYFGQIPPPASQTEEAADLIGQGKVLASPMVMATAVGSIEAGKTVVPQLVTSVKAKVPAGVRPLTPAEDAQLKKIFREVVLTGTGSGLRAIPGGPVIAKTGTAEFGQTGKTLTHAWMVAAQGDLAVCVYVDTGLTGAGTAGPIMAAFLRAADASVTPEK